jgi:hypothetical protein
MLTFNITTVATSLKTATNERNYTNTFGMLTGKADYWCAGSEYNRSSTPFAKVKNKWIYTSNPAYVFIVFLN